MNDEYLTGIEIEADLGKEIRKYVKQTLNFQNVLRNRERDKERVKLA